MTDYPECICNLCGTKFGSREPSSGSTWHMGKCDVCGRTDVPCTEPRDFGHLTVAAKSEK